MGRRPHGRVTGAANPQDCGSHRKPAHGLQHVPGGGSTHTSHTDIAWASPPIHTQLRWPKLSNQPD